jgi:benzoate transport
MNSSDPRDIVSAARMSRLQIAVVAITICLNALDGFDVLSISFASPGIAAEWGIAPGALGIVLSMELVGMALGSVFLGGVADTIGRRRTVLGCLTVMVAGMYLVTTATSLASLSLWRVFTGIGIGGMLAATNAVAAEFSNAKRRHLSVSLMAIGYPVGAVLGGTIASQLLATYDWRSVFYLGTVMTAAFLPVVFFLVPESVSWLARKQPPGALDKINGTLRRMGHDVVRALPDLPEQIRRKSIADIFGADLIATTAILTVAYFCHITTFYFILKWVPKIVVDMGFAASSAGGVLVWANVGGATGGAVLGLLTMRFGLKPLTIGVLVLSAIGVTLFGRSPPDLSRLALVCAFAGFFTNAGVVGLFAIFARAYPTHVRAFGTGFSIGVGRGGSVLAPIIAGFLLESGISVPNVALIMGMGALVAAVALLFLKLDADGAAPEARVRTKPAVLATTAPPSL